MSDSFKDHKPNHTTHNNKNIQTGLVMWGTRNIFQVLPIEQYNLYCSGQLSEKDVLPYFVECRIKGKRQQNNVEQEKNEKTFLSAMDYVEYMPIDLEKSHKVQGYIVSRLKRKKHVDRKKNNSLYVVAVNLDVLGIVLSVDQPSFRPRFADRLVCICLEQDIQPFIILNKTDLLPQLEDTKQKQILERIKVYSDIGIKVFLTSSLEESSIVSLREACQKNVCAFVGQSGVGKSTIVNHLIPQAKRNTDTISKKYNRGKHITTRPEVILGQGLSLVDTPGIRDLFPSRITQQNIGLGYPDIIKYEGQCRLPNCLHYKEDDCTIKAKVGVQIHQDRYTSYVRFLDDIYKWQTNKYLNKKTPM